MSAYEWDQLLWALKVIGFLLVATAVLTPLVALATKSIAADVAEIREQEAEMRALVAHLEARKTAGTPNDTREAP